MNIYEKIILLKYNYIARYNIERTLTLFLGKKEYEELLKSCEFMPEYFKTPENKPYYCCGMEVVEVDKISFLSVGYVEEWEE